jgi:hypothetical protein
LARPAAWRAAMGGRRLAEHPLLDGLVSYWTLDETSGTRADSVGANHMTPVGSVSYDTGVLGNAASFVPATNDYLTKAVPVGVDFGDSDFTVMVWFNTHVMPEYGNYWTLLAHNWSYASQGKWMKQGFGVRIAYNHSMPWAIYGGLDTQTIVHAYEVLEDAWQLCFAHHDSVNDKIVCVNYGRSTEEADCSTGMMNPDTPTPLRIGCAASAETQWMSGLLDEAAIWGRLLTSAEKAWLYNSGAGRTFAEIAAYTG